MLTYVVLTEPSQYPLCYYIIIVVNVGTVVKEALVAPEYDSQC